MDRSTFLFSSLVGLALGLVFFLAPVWGKTPYRHLMDYWHYNQAAEELNEAGPAVDAILATHSMQTKGQRQQSQSDRSDQTDPEITREQYEASVEKIGEFQSRAEGDWPQSARWLITTVLNDELSFGSRHVASSFCGLGPRWVNGPMWSRTIGFRK